MKKMIKFVLIFLALFIITGCGCEKKLTNKTIIEENKAKNDVVVEDLVVTDIKLIYEGSITTLTAKINNNNEENKNFIISIILKDDNGKEVKKLKQVIENLDNENYQTLSIGIVGDYSNIKNVEFYIEKDY
ncbi:MAG: hypothetical protein PHN42_01640 [Bacilli bacterium]|nr:hypothetical protein [Bacilli bacterium]